MSDQADHLRQLVRQAVQARPTLGPGLPIIVLSGGSSGVGTTSLALQLARELARLGKRTILVDANFESPQLAAGFDARPHGCLADVLDGNRSANEVLQTVDDGISLLASGPITDTSPDLSRTAVARLITELRSLGEQADLVLVDAGHGMTPWVQRWWRVAQQIFLVVTEEESVVKDSYVTVKLAPWGDADGKLRLVVNKCEDRSTAEQITNRFSATCRRFLGLHVDAAPSVATCDDDPSSPAAIATYRDSVRLLATDVISHNVIVSGRITNQTTNRGGRVADMIAVPEKSFESSNNLQAAPHE